MERGQIAGVFRRLSHATEGLGVTHFRVGSPRENVERRAEQKERPGGELECCHRGSKI
jgi:hypothetical protein